MLQFRFLFLAIFGLLASASSQAQIEWDEDNLCKIVRMEQQHAHRPSPLVDRSTYPARTYDLTYHRLSWELDPDRHYIKGTVFSRFNIVEGPISQLYFELSSLLLVDSVQYHGERIPFLHTRNDWLNIFLPQTLAQGVEDSITVYYQGAPRTDTRSFEQDTHATAPIIWTLSQPYGAKDWWPCKQALDDKIDSIDTYVTVPQGNKAATNGTLQSVTEAGDQQVYHWKHRYPIPAYLIAVAVTNYASFTDYYIKGQDSLAITNYVYPQDSARYRDKNKSTLFAMAFFDSLFTPYPFLKEQYGHAQFGWPGGMEHQTMSFMFNFTYALVAHELAHQWFGDMVTCGSWSDIWLNEGFATFLEGITYQTLEGGKYWENWKTQTVERVLREPNGSVYVYADDTLDVSRTFYSNLTYRKGAMVLHMLRWTLGDSAFFGGLRNYLNDPKLRFGYAKTPDLKRHLEIAGDTTLGEFFEDWIYGKGFPSYQLDVVQETDSVILTVNQTPSDSSVDFFEMLLPVQLNFLTFDTLLVLEHRVDGQRFGFAASEPLQRVIWDPETWLAVELDTLTSVRSPEAAIPLQAYPQPAAQKVMLDLPAQSHDLVGQLYDLNGKVLRTYAFPAEITVEIELNGLTAGVYFLRIKGRDTSWQARILKQ